MIRSQLDGHQQKSLCVTAVPPPPYDHRILVPFAFQRFRKITVLSRTFKFSVFSLSNALAPALLHTNRPKCAPKHVHWTPVALAFGSAAPAHSPLTQHPNVIAILPAYCKQHVVSRIMACCVAPAASALHLLCMCLIRLDSFDIFDIYFMAFFPNQQVNIFDTL